MRDAEDREFKLKNKLSDSEFKKFVALKNERDFLYDKIDELYTFYSKPDRGKVIRDNEDQLKKLRANIRIYYDMIEEGAVEKPSASENVWEQKPSSYADAARGRGRGGRGRGGTTRPTSIVNANGRPAVKRDRKKKNVVIEAKSTDNPKALDEIERAMFKMFHPDSSEQTKFFGTAILTKRAGLSFYVTTWHQAENSPTVEHNGKRYPTRREDWTKCEGPENSCLATMPFAKLNLAGVPASWALPQASVREHGSYPCSFMGFHPTTNKFIIASTIVHRRGNTIYHSASTKNYSCGSVLLDADLMLSGFTMEPLEIPNRDQIILRHPLELVSTQRKLLRRQFFNRFWLAFPRCENIPATSRSGK
jgi:hypothetical protein